MRRMKRKATTADIAEALGLSRTTVSKALNGHPTVPDATRQRVLKTAARLRYKHYREDQLQNALSDDRQASGRAMRTIACLIRAGSTSNEGYWAEVLQGIEQASRQNGCNMVLHFITADDLDELRMPRSLTEAGVGGVILVGITRRAYIRAIAELALPAVLIDCFADTRAADTRFDTVLMESEQSVYDLTAHLIGLGHRRIGFVGDVGDCLSFAERWNGYRRAMLDGGLSVDPASCAVAPAPNHYFDYAETARAIAAMPQLPTAFVCANDLVAYQTIRALQAAGRRVPEDVSVTGFDMTSRGGTPAYGMRITSVPIQPGVIGSRACEQLVRRMDRPDLPIEHVRLATRMAEGETTTAAPAHRA